jgi:phenylpropionate dioxygenase-like ring-hydroxylating dioxygenase large terminal subunit
VARLPDQWFIACRSRALRDRPRAVRVQGLPLVLFRDGGGRAGALEDRCPHRNAPLTAGRLRGGALECAYHGWRFDAAGTCLAVPGLATPPQARAVQATAFPCVEQDGYVWVYSTAGATPRCAPFRFPLLDAPGYTTARRDLEVRSTLLAALENTLDVPHTAFLHGGLFRTSRARTEIDVVVRRFADRCEAEFVGEPRPEGLAARLLAPRGGVVTHVDRFLLPSIAQVEYRLGDASHLVVTTAMTPVDDFLTRLFVAVSFRLPLPGWLVRPLVTPAAARIFAQDARILALQADNVRRFGGERFASTELDVLGPQIWRLLRQAERGELRVAHDAADHEHRLRMRV